MTISTVFDDQRDQFPIGMRVLIVDDDVTCLRVLETMLHKCQYHVTATSHAFTALELLRENRNKFDLVISDVQMPDMDGFKLLELVGLEMDLPVIMLSSNGDHELVMKGVTHGACDYLVKPVRIQELKNIWQHVVRRKKGDSKDQTNSGNQDKSHIGSCGQGMGNSDQNVKLNKKRKDQDEDEDDNCDEDGYDNDDPSTQKKPRVVWSVDLHRKFVAAVNKLGIDKAVPKKILDLMNEDKLTRENVASHLQKFRLYLKRISCAANQQANMMAAIGSSDSSYLRMGSFNGVRNYQALTGPGQFNNTGFRSMPLNGMIGRVNTPAGLGLHCLPSSGSFKLGQGQRASNSILDQGIFHGNRNGSMLQGNLELDQRHIKGATSVQDLSAGINGTPVFPNSSGFSDAKLAMSRSTDALGLTDNTVLRHPQDFQGGREYVNQSSLPVAPLKTEYPASFMDHGRLNDSWSSAAQSSIFRSNSFPNTRESVPVAISPQMRNSQFDVATINSVSSQLQVPRPELLIQPSSISSTARQMIDSDPTQGWMWMDHKQDSPYHHSDAISNSTGSLMPANIPVDFDQNLDSKGTTLQRNMNMDFNSIGQQNFLDPLHIKFDDVERSLDTSMNLEPGYVMDQRKPQGGLVSNNHGLLDDLVGAMTNQLEKR
ncbi:two-component response regulator ARR12 [Argentina anserina]|uniref:two-component response regulator ARR12 n=1 Tax=Argentina anserina TaxID=57926 RepID=UPI0021763AB4|nr:two-component response regulator ARR12 [Potentilla anserina]